MSLKYDMSACPFPCVTQILSVSKLSIRYLTIQNNKADLLKDINNGELKDVEPLFLGIDLFVDCGVPQSSLHKTHAKYCKEGKAVKVLLKDFRIDEIKNTKLWFYNIQGLFSVVFQYHSHDVQRECLKTLTNVWLHQHNNSKLQETMTICLNEKSAEYFLSTKYPEFQLSNKNITNSLECDNPAKKRKTSSSFYIHDSGSKNVDSEPILVESTSCQMSIQNIGTQTETNSNTFNSKARLVDSFTQTDENDLTSYNFISQKVSMRSVYTQTENTNRLHLHDLQTKESNITGISEIFEDAKQNHHTSITDNCKTRDNFQNCDYYSKESISKDPDDFRELQVISSTLKCPYCLYLSKEHKEMNQHLTNCLIRLNQFIMFEYDETSSEFLATFYNMVSFFLDHYPKIVYPQSFLNDLLNEFQNISFDNGKHIETLFLNFLCKYVGKEMHKFDDEISRNVETFKESHLRCIDNLPPPEEIIDLIFPQCMKMLIFHWMNPVPLEACDQPTDNQLDYHMIQIILEFVNNALISGVAHVVYSRIKSLKC